METKTDNQQKNNEYDFSLPSQVLSRITVINDIPDAPKEEVKNKPEEVKATTPPPVSEEEKVSTAKEDKHLKSKTDKQPHVKAKEQSPVIPDKREEILKIEQKAYRYLDILSELNTDEVNINRLKKVVDKVWQDCFFNYLYKTPIEALNDRKVGIRVSALKNAGYTSIASIYNLSYRDLISIHGVGEKSVDLIEQERERIIEEVRRNVRIKPQKENRDDVFIVKEFYKWRHLQMLQKEVDERYSLAEQNIKEYLIRIGNISRLVWRLAPEHKKASKLSYAMQLNTILTDSLYAGLMKEKALLTSINNAGTDACFADYEKNRSIYDAAFSGKLLAMATEASQPGRKKKSPAPNRRTLDGTNSTLLKVILALSLVVAFMLFIKLSNSKDNSKDNGKDNGKTSPAIELPTEAVQPTATEVPVIVEDVSPELEEPILLEITAELANIRKGPSSKTEIVTKAKRGTVFTGTGKSEKADNGGLWFEIYMDEEQTKTAWVSEQVSSFIE